MNLPQRRALDSTRCRECGGRMFISPAGVAYHGSKETISHDDDADHTAASEGEITEDEAREMRFWAAAKANNFHLSKVTIKL